MCPTNALKCTLLFIIISYCYIFEIASTFCYHKHLSGMTTELNSKRKYLKFWAAKLKGKDKKEKKKETWKEDCSNCRASHAGTRMQVSKTENALPSTMVLEPSYHVNQLRSSRIVGSLCIMEYRNLRISRCNWVNQSHVWSWEPPSGTLSSMVLTLASGSKQKRRFQEATGIDHIIQGKLGIWRDATKLEIFKWST